MMSQSWMGTDFTNDDLVKEASIVEDYSHRIAGEDSLDGRACWILELVPKPESAVVWGRILLWIDRRDFLMLRAEYFDEEGILVNTLVAGEVKMLGGRLLPSRMEMMPVDKPGNKTVLLYRSLVFDRDLSDDFFSTQNMQRVQ
jgi:outer membrane lipoprotein-sorting protein